MRRAVVIFPRFSNLETLEHIRRRFDPLAEFISAHITLVFPFESEVPDERIAAHLKGVAASFEPFEIVLSGITGSEGEYLFLNVKHGNDKLTALHDKLYLGVFEPYLSLEHTYCPHLTVGRISDTILWKDAVNELATFKYIFTCVVRSFNLYQIHPDGRRPARLEVSLGRD